METARLSVTILPDSVPRRNEAILDRELDGETVLFNIRTNKLHSLNATASFIWRYCTGTYTVNRLAELLGRSFAVTAEQAEADLRFLLAGMHDEGLIEL